MRKSKKDLITTTRSRKHVAMNWVGLHRVERLKQVQKPKTTAVTALPLDPFPHRKTGKKAICHAHAPCYVVFFWLFRLETAAVQNKFSSISISNVPHCWMNSIYSNSSSISKNSSNSSQKHPNSFMFSTNLLKKPCSSRKHANAVWQKKRSLICCC